MIEEVKDEELDVKNEVDFSSFKWYHNFDNDLILEIADFCGTKTTLKYLEKMLIDLKKESGSLLNSNYVSKEYKSKLEHEIKKYQNYLKKIKDKNQFDWKQDK